MVELQKKMLLMQYHPWEHLKVEDRGTSRSKMSMLRRKVAERLVEAKNTTAMLTTFNEVDMSPIFAFT